MASPQPCVAVLTGTYREGGQSTPEFAEYSRRSVANGEAHQGRLIGRYRIATNLADGSTPDVVFVVEYPSREIAERVFTNDEYAAIVPLRDIAFKEVQILLAELAEPADPPPAEK